MRIHRDVKIAFLSIILASEERLDVLKKEGVSDYITNPFNNEDLVGRINRTLTG